MRKLYSMNPGTRHVETAQPRIALVSITKLILPSPPPTPVTIVVSPPRVVTVAGRLMLELMHTALATVYLGTRCTKRVSTGVNNIRVHPRGWLYASLLIHSQRSEVGEAESVSLKMRLVA
jgi:hypothetical protein